jgi:hypothetical protein
VLTGAAVVVALVLGAGAYMLGADRTGSPSALGAPVTAPPAPTLTPSPVAPATDPLVAASAWLRGYRTQSWTDPRPWSWTTRVLPVVTGQLAGEYRTVQSAPGGAEWADYVARRCATAVSAVGAVIPGEAPRSDTEVYVQVSGEALTQCGVGAPPGEGAEHLAATVELLRGPDGLWRVTNRLY